MNIIDFYRSVLSCAAVHVDEDDFLHLVVNGEHVPLTIEKKPVALPTKKHLAKADDGVILFHPVSESLVRKESPVARQLRRLLITRVNEVALNVIESLIDYAANTESHSKASPDERDFLSLVPTLDVKLQTKIVDKVLSKFDGKMDTRIVSQTIRTSDKLNNEEFKRVSRISFPLLSKLDVTKKKWNNVTFSGKDIAVIESLLNYVFPRFQVKDAYSTGSHELKVPSLHCMLSGLVPIYSQLNDISANFDMDSAWQFNLDFIDGLESLAKYKAVIPAQPGNTGDPLEVIEGEKEEMPGHARSSVASHSKPDAGATVEAPAVHAAAKPKAEPVAKLPLWKQQIEERKLAEQAPGGMGGIEIEGAISPAEYDKLNWSEKRSYDTWYNEQLAAHQARLEEQLRRSQPVWRTGGGYHGGYQGGYQGQGNYQSAPAIGMHGAPMSAREEYEMEKQYLQQRSNQYGARPRGYHGGNSY